MPCRGRGRPPPPQNPAILPRTAPVRVKGAIVRRGRAGGAKPSLQIGSSGPIVLYAQAQVVERPLQRTAESEASEGRRKERVRQSG